MFKKSKSITELQFCSSAQYSVGLRVRTEPHLQAVTGKVNTESSDRQLTGKVSTCKCLQLCINFCTVVTVIPVRLACSRINSRNCGQCSERANKQLSCRSRAKLTVSFCRLAQRFANPTINSLFSFVSYMLTVCKCGQFCTS